MSLLRFLGLGGASGDAPDDGEDVGGGETGTVRRIAERLGRLEPEQARYLAAFAYVLARVAHADLHFDETETSSMREIVELLAELSPEESELVVEIAKSQARLLGGTENYVVTREFRKMTTREQKGKLLESLYAVAAADGTISAAESHEILAIAEELGFTRPEALALRSAYREHLAELQGGPARKG